MTGFGVRVRSTGAKSYVVVYRAGRDLGRVGAYVVPGDDLEKPRHDLKRPWDAVTKRADLVGVRLHDLRHTYASFGAGGVLVCLSSAAC